MALNNHRIHPIVHHQKEVLGDGVSVLICRTSGVNGSHGSGRDTVQQGLQDGRGFTESNVLLRI